MSFEGCLSLGLKTKLGLENTLVLIIPFFDFTLNRILQRPHLHDQISRERCSESAFGFIFFLVRITSKQSTTWILSLSVYSYGTPVDRSSVQIRPCFSSRDVLVVGKNRMEDANDSTQSKSIEFD